GNSDESDSLFTIGSAPITNYAVDFDGSTQHIAITDHPDFDMDTDWTIEAWVKSSATGQEAIVSQYDGSSGYTLFKIGSTLYFQYVSGGVFQNTSAALGASGGFNDGTWHHVAVALGGSNGKLYVDGLPIQSNNTMLPVDESTADIHIGYTAGVGGFTGSVDEVRFWDHTRTDTEISTNYNVQLSGQEAGLIAYYNFSDGTGSTTASDATLNGHIGVLSGMDNLTDWVEGPSLGSPPFTTTALFPAPGQIFVPIDASMTMLFTDTVKSGTGSLQLINLTDTSVVQTFDAEIDLIYTANVVSFAPSSNLISNTEYAILVDSGAIVQHNDSAAFSGFTDYSWSFTTYSGDSIAPIVNVVPVDTTYDQPALTGFIDDIFASLDVVVNGMLYTAIVNPDATWDLLPGVDPLSPGTYNVRLIATDTTGNVTDSTFANAITIQAIVPSSITISSFVIPHGEVIQGTNELLLYKFSVAVADAAAIEQGFSLTFGDSTVADVFVDNSFKLKRQINVDDLNTAQIVNSGTDMGQGVPAESIGFLRSDTIPVGDTWYYYVMGDVEPNATPGVIFNLHTPTLNDFGFADPKTKVDGGITLAPVYTITPTDGIAPLVTVDSVNTSETRPGLSGSIDDITASLSIIIDTDTTTAIVETNNTWRIGSDTIAALAVGTHDV
ncbi:MAG: Ig-like domain-containing protein, partial [Cyclobacteriaceae bacterium]